MEILSLGAGVQSSAVLLMSCRGVLPKLDGAVFADTQWEPAEVYDWLSFLEGEAKKADIPLYRVTAGNLRSDVLEKPYTLLPMFTLSDKAEKGQLRRQCTSRYKIEPIQKWLKQYAGGQRVTLWFGISSDETRRMRMSRVAWIENYYPLIFGPRPYSRQDCIRWMEAQGFPPAPRSACIGCPYHSNDEWRRVRADPVQWADAISFDEASRRKVNLDDDLFLHADRVPLGEVDLETLEEKGQQNWLNECEGMCGV